MGWPAIASAEAAVPGGTTWRPGGWSGGWRRTARLGPGRVGPTAVEVSSNAAKPARL